MSETTTATPPVESTPAAPTAPEYIPTHVLSSDPEPEAQPEPGTAAAEPEKPVEPPKPEKTAEEKARENERRRYARLQAERSNEKARADQLEARLRQLENPGQAPQPPRAEDIPRLVQEQAAALRAQERVQEQVNAFHQAGQAAYPDWTDRCNTLVQMGADPAFSELLLETPDGARVTAALADDPEEFERIAGLKTERARSIALGRYSAALESKPAPVVPVSRAPAPIQPPSAGRARGEPDPNGSFDEYRRWSEKQNWDRR